MGSMSETRIAVYDSRGSDYEQAFAVFLANTDQKDRAREWLEQTVARLPNRRTLIDAGAGTGKVTAWLTPHFSQTVAIEPNPHLREELQQNCPDATILPEPILEARPGVQADFVLTSHVFYYIPDEEWLPTLDRLVSFLAPGGQLAIVVQNEGTDCMRMLDHFLGQRFGLSALAHRFGETHADTHRWRIETVGSDIQTADFETATTIAEFILNLLPMSEPPLRRAVQDYVQREFFRPGEGYRFSCSQDFLVIDHV